MSYQKLSEKTCRRIAKVTGQDVLRGWANGGYTYYFVTPDHKHGILNIKTDEWEWETDPVHYTSCYTSWPGKELW